MATDTERHRVSMLVRLLPGVDYRTPMPGSRNCFCSMASCGSTTASSIQGTTTGQRLVPATSECGARPVARAFLLPALTTGSDPEASASFASRRPATSGKLIPSSALTLETNPSVAADAVHAVARTSQPTATIIESLREPSLSRATNCLTHTALLVDLHASLRNASYSSAPDDPVGRRWICLNYVVGADGGHLRQLTSEPSIDANLTWSGDGRWIYFSSSRAGLIPDIWRISPDGGQAVRITRNGGFDPKESSHGRYLFYLDRAPISGHGRLMRAPIGGGRGMVL